jgi:hypothetical protein
VDSDVSDEQLRKQYLGERVKIPDLATVKDFFRFHTALCKPRILNIPSTDSLNSDAERFFSGFKRLTGTEISKDFRSEVYNVSIFTVLRAADKDGCPWF